MAIVPVVAPGCGPKAPADPRPEPVKPKMALFTQEEQARQADAVPEQDYLIQLTIYNITLPVGGVSRSDEFWRHINENAVDVGPHDLLWKNGVRVGIAAAGEWDYLRGTLESNPARTQPSNFTGRESNIELEMKLKVPYQDLFYYDGAGDLTGRTFDRCDNLLRVSFQPAPRKPGTVRLSVCPVVRSLRERLVPTGEASFNPTPYQWIHPEQFFALNLTADIPRDGFLVLAPSPDGKWPSSLGNTFLIKDGATEQTETLLIFRPITFRTKAEVKSVATTRP